MSFYSIFQRIIHNSRYNEVIEWYDYNIKITPKEAWEAFASSYNLDYYSTYKYKELLYENKDQLAIWVEGYQKVCHLKSLYPNGFDEYTKTTEPNCYNWLFIIQSEGTIKEYDDIILQYNEIHNNYLDGLNVYASEKGIALFNLNMSEKKIITTNRDTIIFYDQTIKAYVALEKEAPSGVKAYLKEYLSISAKNIEGKNKVVENRECVLKIEKDYVAFDKTGIQTTCPEGIILFLGLSSYPVKLNHNDIKSVLSNIEVVQNLQNIYYMAWNLAEKYPKAWALLIQTIDGVNEKNLPCSKFKGTPLLRLSLAAITRFSQMEQELQITENYINARKQLKNSLIEYIIGVKNPPTNGDFTETGIARKKSINEYVYPVPLESYEPYKTECTIEDRDIRIKVILSSQYYGDKIRFQDSYTIERFYKLIALLKSCNTTFDQVYEFRDNNKDAIKAFNFKRTGKAIFYTDDFEKIAKHDSELFSFIETYANFEKVKIRAEKIKSQYPLGYNYFISKGIIEENTADINTLTAIIDKEIEIAKQNNILKAENIRKEFPQEVYSILNIDRYVALTDILAQNIIQAELKIKAKHQEIIEEQARKERIRQEYNSLYSKTSSWPNKGIPCFSMFYYYPTTCDWEVNEHEWEIRKMIWAFKNNPARTTPTQHQIAMERVLKYSEKVLKYFFGSNTSKLTFVCITASTQNINKLRYEEFSKRLCSTLYMKNGYEHITIVQDATPKHLGGDGLPVLSIDNSFFKDKYIILFDDVTTSGTSLNRYKYLLEKYGSKVIGALTIGITKHERMGQEPIDEIFWSNSNRYEDDLPF